MEIGLTLISQAFALLGIILVIVPVAKILNKAGYSGMALKYKEEKQRNLIDKEKNIWAFASTKNLTIAQINSSAEILAKIPIEADEVYFDQNTLILTKNNKIRLLDLEDQNPQIGSDQKVGNK